MWTFASPPGWSETPSRIVGPHDGEGSVAFIGTVKSQILPQEKQESKKTKGALENKGGGGGSGDYCSSPFANPIRVRSGAVSAKRGALSRTALRIRTPFVCERRQRGAKGGLADSCFNAFSESSQHASKSEKKRNFHFGATYQVLSVKGSAFHQFV